MLVILPPSEGKTSPDSGPKLAPGALSRPALTRPRSQVRTALIELCRTDPSRATTVLGLGPTQQGLVDANSHLRTAPCAPAIEVYTGVVYEALGFATLPKATRARGDERLVIASALFGLLSPSDLIPAYRLSGDCTLPPIGGLGNVWRTAVQAELLTTTGVVLDMRSGAYAALAPLPAQMRERAASVQVLLEKNGRRSVVSHHNKATKGRLARAILESGRTPARLDQVEAYLDRLGFRAELTNSPKGIRLDVVVAQA